jgi:lipopolysaccharide transport system permease protein
MLASLGVYLRDIGQGVSIFTTVLLFMAPVFYPAHALPDEVQPLLLLNPLTFAIEQARDVLIWERMPDFIGLLKYFACSLLVMWGGFACFQKTRRGFADAI